MNGRVVPIKTVFGGYAFPKDTFSEPSIISEALSLLHRSEVTNIDTARLYAGSEEAIGKQSARTSFTIDTKLPGGLNPGSATKEGVLRDVQDSLARLKVSQVDILYLHAPDDTVPIEETLEGIDEAYKRGWFKRFGLSNFTPQQVQRIYDVAKERRYVLPTVYQANYSPVARHLETILFPTLRKLSMSIYVYSPLAGGFLAKTPADLDAGAGRFNPQVMGGMYLRLYGKPSLRAALDEWNAIAEAEGVSKAELAYRWVGYNSALTESGDAVIFGASRLAQIEETAKWLKKGGLSEASVDRIEKLWHKVKDEAPVDNFGGNKM